MQIHYTHVQSDFPAHSKAFTAAAQFTFSVLLPAGFICELKESLHFSKVQMQHWNSAWQFCLRSACLSLLCLMYLCHKALWSYKFSYSNWNDTKRLIHYFCLCPVSSLYVLLQYYVSYISLLDIFIGASLNARICNCLEKCHVNKTIIHSTSTCNEIV